MAEGNRDARKGEQRRQQRLIYYDLSPNQLEAKAIEMLRKFDSTLLEKPKTIDVYAVIEKCLDVPYDWKYITPDQSILGATAFNDGYMYVWDKPYYKKGMMPKKIFLGKGTILIDSTLTEGDDRGRENFTVIHETFHQVLHKRCFAHSKADYTHATYAKALGDRRKPKTAIEIIEYQANSCAAYFLMPRNVILAVYDKFASTTISANSKQSWAIAYKMAPEFNVSATAMHYRLEALGKFR